MDLFMKEISSIIKFMEKVTFSLIQEHIHGFKTENTSETGKIIKCMEKEELSGLMEKFMKEIIKMTENMVLVHSAGQMEENMSVNGRMANSMEEENIIYLIKVKKLANGSKERE